MRANSALVSGVSVSSRASHPLSIRIERQSLTDEGSEYTEDVLTEGVCSPVRVGYTIPEAVISQIGLSPYLYDLFSNVLSAFLIVHPVV
jgi:hypothetical protein